MIGGFKLSLDGIFAFIDQFGYWALFLSFYVCLLGLPIPNEILVMSGGFLSTTTYLNPILTFVIVFFTVILNATILFFLGKTFGNRLIELLKKRKGLGRKLVRSSVLIQRYGPYAAALCYLLPVMRHFIPFLMGTYSISYRKFALYSYSSALVWTLILYLIGMFFGSNLYKIGQNLNDIGAWLLGILIFISLLKMIKKQIGTTPKLDEVK